MTTKKAIVEWIPANQGGRRQPPLGVGQPAYSTVVRFNEDPWPPADAAWSLVIEKQESQSTEHRWTALVHFLAPEAPHHALRGGRGFELYEGSRRVATGELCQDDGRDRDGEAST
jgi:hypothetical protein